MQFPPGGNPRIELAQAAGCGITRIGKHFLAGGLLPLVQGQKIGLQHQHFAAHFDQSGNLAAVQPQGDVGDGFHILGNVFTRFAVATSSAAHQYAILVQQADCQTIEFGFDHISRFFAAQTAAHALVKRQHFAVVEHAVFVLRRKSVGERQHRHFVAYALESFQRCATHPLGRAVGQAKLGMGRFQRFQFAE